MKIKLNDGSTFVILNAIGGTRMIDGVNRNSIDFVFPAEIQLPDIDKAFTSNSCEKIHLFTDDENEYIHEGYTIRWELSKRLHLTNESSNEYRVTVTMVKRTESECMLKNLTETVDVLVADILSE